MTTVEPSHGRPDAAAGPRGAGAASAGNFAEHLINTFKKEDTANKRAKLEGSEASIGHGDVVIAAITSCTNTSNPNVMIGAGLVAQKAVKRGLKVRPWVKTSLAPGSQVVTDYLAKAGVDKALDKLGFTLAGYGCTTCIGNSGPLPEPVAKAITEADLVAAAVISGNRNFEGRVHPQVRANYLASPMLVVAYALAGSVNMDLTKEPVGYDKKNEPVYLKDIWPQPEGNLRRHRQGGEARQLQEALWQCLQRRRQLAQGQAGQGPDLSVGHRLDLCEEPALLRRHDHRAQAGGGNRRAPACWRCSAIPSPPTTSRPPATSRRPRRAASICPSTRWRRRISIPMARAAAISKLMERGTFANIRIRNEMMGGAEGGNTVYYSEPDARGRDHVHLRRRPGLQEGRPSARS